MEINHKFIHLRSRSSYSLAQGAILVDELVQLAKKDNMPALALTDEGNLFGALEFSLKAVEQGIQPIMGCILKVEVSSQVNGHDVMTPKKISKVLLLVKNKLGWENLSSLVSKSFLDDNDGNQRPIRLEELFKHSSGLLCLLGGLEGPVGQFLLENKFSEAFNISKLFKKNFSDNLFIEVSRHGLEEENKTEPSFIKISSDSFRKRKKLNK